MSRTEHRKRVCPIAVLALAIACAVPGLAVVSLTPLGPITLPPAPGATLAIVFPLLAVITGAIAVRRIGQSGGTLAGRFFAVAAIILGALCFTIVFAGITRPVVGRAFPPTCGTNLAGLGKAIMLYAADFNDSLPAGDQWCDLLAEHASATSRLFICPHSRIAEGQSSYAMNANVIGWKQDKLPRDVVLLFESKPGWNQVGGPELLAPENHAGEGCNILFGDKGVKFVKRDQLTTLRWNPN